MSTASPIIKQAVVELTFANGITKRLIFDDKDMPVGLELSAETDIDETTPDDASCEPSKPAPARR